MQWYGPIVEIETKSGGSELLREIARLGGIWRSSWWSMEMKKKKSHTFAQFTCVELLSGGMLIALREGKIGIL